MEFASEFVIKAAQLRAKDHRNSDHAVAGQARASATPAEFSRRSGGNLRFMLLYAPNWLFLLPGAALVVVGLAIVFWFWLPGAGGDAARGPGCAHDDFWRDVHPARRADISIGAFAKVFSYAERFDRKNVSLKSRAHPRDVSKPGCCSAAGCFLVGLRGCAWVVWDWVVSGFGPLEAVRQVLFWSMWLFHWRSGDFFFVFSQHAGYQQGHVHRATTNSNRWRIQESTISSHG